MPVLIGAQGLGKTTLIQKMGQFWFTNSVESFEGIEAAELLQGVWIVEIGEMSAGRLRTKLTGLRLMK
ncbi:hypothetical protein CR203_03390 [Salipaludibacillus neizhouensis]|uniref:Virulence-associated protein E-like domain-containing protein n=1 Tax=Salipaludibacillus neizhouensis TaxID=885475 RepID=A0A3A9K7X6_9BACI|nr:hypothetical protein CR203_03390 [Salipaludibacillus neizhouensis]